ncbi:VanZ family protein [Rhizobium wuzhouense]|uniref:VanZ family protein n=1 Tax=Rhizobium wuzhouense TaxID=1986026 RepID=A0ABX5NUB9_9HYPH|nr:VanZ family protein [Rhizobium wuzhouense]PYB75035.1 VanZ family protein [Rhizobium wuzhouense]
MRPHLPHDRWIKLAAWLLLGFCVAATVVPIGLRPHAMLPPNADRALAFAAVGALFALAYPRYWLLIAILLVGGAFAIESMQYLSPSRHPSLSDAVVKSAGALVGIAVMRALLFAWARGRGAR